MWDDNVWDFDNPTPELIDKLKENLAYAKETNDNKYITLFEGLLWDAEDRLERQGKNLIYRMGGTIKTIDAGAIVRSMEGQTPHNPEKKMTMIGYEQFILNEDGSLRLPEPKEEAKAPTLPYSQEQLRFMSRNQEKIRKRGEKQE